MAVDDQVRWLLLGTTVRAVRRSVDMGDIEFIGPRDESIAAHVQCPWRIVHQGKLVLGSRDMQFPQPGAGANAFDEFKMMYDLRAAALNKILEQLKPVVTEVVFTDAGQFSVAWESEFRLDVFPACSGQIEAWRVFAMGGGTHYGFPESVI